MSSLVSRRAPRRSRFGAIAAVNLLAGVLVLFVLLPARPEAQSARAGAAVSGEASTGAIEGSVVSADGLGIGMVIVTLEPSRLVRYTDESGAFAFQGVPAGTYVVRLSAGGLQARVIDVQVAAGHTASIVRVMPRDFTVSMNATVVAPSKVQEERLEAPAAVNVLEEATIALEGGSGQLPALLQFTPGAEYTQSGVYNIEFNARGFNGSLSRRVQVLLDGRDLAAPENKNQEWITVGFLVPELERIEFVRGPAAALYGANSINGVVALTTKTPRGSRGGRASLTAGDLDTLIGDVRWAGALGRDWYTRLLVNHTRSGGFSRTRTETAEYPGVPPEIAPATPGVQATAADARFDKYTRGGRRLALETGFSQSEGGTYLSQGGRFNVLDATRTWSRVSLDATHWSTQAYLNTRNGTTDSLFAPAQYVTATEQFKAEVQRSQHFAGSRGRAVAGASFLLEHADSADDHGVQTLYQQAVTTRAPALFGQLDYDLTPALKVVTAMRWDDSTLHTPQWSPRAALVYLPVPDQSLRVSFNRGFQVGNYNELFVNIPLSPPLDLSMVDAAFEPFLGGTSLGFAAVPVFAKGNASLTVEKVQSVEAGYSGTFGSRVQIDVDVYRNSMRDFISDILPGINPAFPAYVAPAALPAPVRAVIEQTVNANVPGLTNLPNGNPEIVYSLGNVGLVSSTGVEAEARYRPRRGWSLHGSYTRFDFRLVKTQPGLEPKPNAPRNRAAVGATYERPRFAASIHHRWVDGFHWASGLFVGDVPSYDVADVNALYRVTKRWQVGANISNLLDRRHYEMFGGDILRRRALVHTAVNW